MAKNKAPQPKLRIVAGADGPEAWAELPLEGRWFASYRVIPHRGVPVVAELRIAAYAPTRALRTPSETVRRTDGTVLAESFQEAESGLPAVPQGGLTARILRRAVLGQHRRAVREAIASFDRRSTDARAKREASGAGWIEGRCPECDATYRAFRNPSGKRKLEREPACPTHHAPLVDVRATTSPSGGFVSGMGFARAETARPVAVAKRRGRKPRPALFYARWADRYDRLTAKGNAHPCATLARRHELPETRVRDYMREARRLGLLTGGAAARKDRVADGKLTDEGRRVLEGV